MKSETEIERWLRELASDEQRTDNQRAAAPADQITQAAEGSVLPSRDHCLA